MIRNKLVGNGVINQIESVFIKRYGIVFSAQEREFIRSGGRTVLDAIVKDKSAGRLSAEQIYEKA